MIFLFSDEGLGSAPLFQYILLSKQVTITIMQLTPWRQPAGSCLKLFILHPSSSPLSTLAGASACILMQTRPFLQGNLTAETCHHRRWESLLSKTPVQVGPPSLPTEEPSCTPRSKLPTKAECISAFLSPASEWAPRRPPPPSVASS